MTSIALVRHGETAWNAAGRLQGTSDVPLNENGRQQARATAAILADSHWDVLVSSPLMRAADTATIIGEAVGLPVTEHLEALVERGYGKAEGITDEEAMSRWPDGNFPGMDSEETVTRHGMDGVNELRRQFPTGRVLAVTHGTLIRLVMSEVVGYPVDHIHNATVSEIHYSDGAWHGVQINSVPITPEHTGAMPS
ncbi:histidine phosphatase family protein [Spelaeicoccus albus]|uniref:Putative phosphoglycerate mutase n=1 Tax=Spelaeicoccus albus TaxID=1280376 RepID=A0A7Z0II10_9MICO|nr:histidine phosphatase family protein [Spelaeicoccus albus]NYI68133.1 putative phosphoglycerate mutase [Spelaeicoccus albus]